MKAKQKATFMCISDRQRNHSELVPGNIQLDRELGPTLSKWKQRTLQFKKQMKRSWFQQQLIPRWAQYQLILYHQQVPVFTGRNFYNGRFVIKSKLDVPGDYVETLKAVTSSSTKCFKQKYLSKSSEITTIVSVQESPHRSNNYYTGDTQFFQIKNIRE